ncbi:hypothetical protein A3C59_00020 [Candidatus Daviesbacteria bacterium RIFCSPHIGHO2_02_FULL_36_13]|uniref:Carbonic anhydrase n=1 Tax=Candidatus Daviesbacteria bacterium RIFCSPHIGHO2_02_FULL_36_13 TaxID=1797768 RepID=A0A1F5JYA9_9BACT|nr:MAG: hypothetical protein A3C59_00020 [Candidatus Daviesbacteria bacterium RIFCSPHIGHO2_02_FULL_36_13]OGE40885.1 MAG: hypothetical protein A3A45_01385 [Candidatus Daviesbacteria bacterium RIFCSPLOWO2_01_FULL_36_8]
MEKHEAEAIVITCIDFRFQEYIHNWLEENFKPRTFDRGAFAGAAKNLDTILTQIDVAVRLHKIKKAVLINHEDCGAYGVEGHVDHHVRDLHAASKTIKERFPDLKVETYYLKLDGAFQPIV